jgi:hypothetical protein
MLVVAVRCWQHALESAHSEMPRCQQHATLTCLRCVLGTWTGLCFQHSHSCTVHTSVGSGRRLSRADGADGDSDDDVSLLDLKDKGKKAKQDGDDGQDPDFCPDA